MATGATRALLFRVPALAAAAGAVGLWVLLAILAGPAFRTWAGTATVLNAAAPLGILSAFVALLVIGGEFDLSIGAIIGASGVLMATLIAEAGWDPAAAAAAGLAFALAIGAFNGTVVTRTGLPSFIVTLSVMFALRGATIAASRAVTGRTQIALPWGDGATETVLTAVLASEAGGVRVSVAWWIGATAVLAWVLHRTVFGNHVLAAGGAPAAARALGVPVARVKRMLFLGTAAGAWLVALIQLLRFGGADALRGQGQEFHAIVAAVIGGALLTGGHGSVAGAAFGALIYGIARQGMVIAGVDADWFQAALGVLLLVAAWLNHRARRAALQAGSAAPTADAASGALTAAPTKRTESTERTGPDPAGPPADTGPDRRERVGAPHARVAAAGAAEPAVGPSAAPALEALAVSRSYGPVHALADVTIAVYPGRVTCLLGDNGAGKSTLIALLTGVDAPDSGDLRRRGAPIRFGSPADARSAGIGVVLQTLGHAPLLSVWRNFALGLPSAGMFARLHAPTIQERARTACADLGVSLDPLDRPVGTLSGGERQALAIARALATSPEVLILDEPTAALGVRARASVMASIRAARDRGVAVLLVTHDPATALAIADEIVVLDRGRVRVARPAPGLAEAELRDLMAGRA